eukprot:5452630-Pleurochrysis_carterae.AAC.1
MPSALTVRLKARHVSSTGCHVDSDLSALYRCQGYVFAIYPYVASSFRVCIYTFCGATALHRLHVPDVVLVRMSDPSHTENDSVRATRHHNHHLQQHQQQHHQHDFPPPPPRSSLPPPLFARPWSRGSVQRVTPPQLSFFYCRRAPESVEAATGLRTKLLQRHTQAHA